MSVVSPTDYCFDLAQNQLLNRKSIISESRLDQDARLVREEMAKRKRARDLHRQKEGKEAKEVMRRLQARGSKTSR